jgi:hypothetical protein
MMIVTMRAGFGLRKLRPSHPDCREFLKRCQGSREIEEGVSPVVSAEWFLLASIAPQGLVALLLYLPTLATK